MGTNGNGNAGQPGLPGVDLPAMALAPERDERTGEANVTTTPMQRLEQANEDLRKLKIMVSHLVEMSPAGRAAAISFLYDYYYNDGFDEE